MPQRSYLPLQIILPVGLALAALTVAPAHAQNLIKDGTFEAADNGAPSQTEDPFDQTGPFDGYWEITQGIVAIDTDNEYVYAGDKSLYLNADTAGPSALSQSFHTQAGQTYLLSFWADDIGQNPLGITFGQTTLPPLTITQNGYPGTDPGSNASEFTFYQYQVTAATINTTLTFSSTTSNNRGIELDNISVTPAPVPEASTLLSLTLLLGLGGIEAAVRRKKARPQN